MLGRPDITGPPSHLWARVLLAGRWLAHLRPSRTVGLVGAVAVSLVVPPVLVGNAGDRAAALICLAVTWAGWVAWFGLRKANHWLSPLLILGGFVIVGEGGRQGATSVEGGVLKWIGILALYIGIFAAGAATFRCSLRRAVVVGSIGSGLVYSLTVALCYLAGIIAQERPPSWAQVDTSMGWKGFDSLALCILLVGIGLCFLLGPVLAQSNADKREQAHRAFDPKKDRLHNPVVRVDATIAAVLFVVFALALPDSPVGRSRARRALIWCTRKQPLSHPAQLSLWDFAGLQALRLASLAVADSP